MSPDWIGAAHSHRASPGETHNPLQPARPKIPDQEQELRTFRARA